MVYVRAKLHNLSSLRGRDPRGVESTLPPPPHPLPPGCEMGSKDPTFLGLIVILLLQPAGLHGQVAHNYVHNW